MASWSRIAVDGRVDLDQASVILGLPGIYVRKLLKQALALHLVLSDGTVSDLAAKFIRAKMAKEFGVSKSKQARKPAEPVE